MGLLDILFGSTPDWNNDGKVDEEDEYIDYLAATADMDDEDIDEIDDFL